MKLTRFLTLLLLLALPIAQAPADEPSSTPVSGSGFVSALPAPEVTVSAGKPATVKLQFSIRSGFHINSNHPNSDLQIPTELKLDAPTDIGIGELTYPPGTELSFSFSPEKFDVYTGDFSVVASVSALRTTAPGNYRVEGVLHYQACSDHACYPPKKLPVGFDVKVLPAKSGNHAHAPAPKSAHP